MQTNNGHRDEIGVILDQMALSVENIMIPWAKVIKVKQNEDAIRVAKIVNCMRANYIDLAVVTDDSDTPLGTVDLQSLRKKSITNSFSRSLLDQRTIQNNTTIQDALKKIVDLKQNNNEIFFIRDEQRKYVGIFNYADFNKRVCYLYTYGIILMLEQLCRLMVEQSYDQRSELRDSWMRYLKPKERKKIRNWSKTNKDSNLSCASLVQLLKVIKKAGLPGFTGHLALEHDSITTAVKIVRHRVAHPVKLLMKRESILSSLKSLLRIWSLKEDIADCLGNRKIGRPNID